MGSDSTTPVSWADLPGAPAVGTRLCRLAEVPDTGTHSVEIEGFPIILVQTHAQIRAYVNACPHQFLPLDYRSAQVLSADGKTLRCTNHAAGFDAKTGLGRDGLGLGCALDAIPVSVFDGIIRIDGGSE